LIKVSKDSNFSLVSNKNLSKIRPLALWASGQMKWAKKRLNKLHLCHSQNTQNQNFFTLRTQRLAKSFEGLNRSLAQLSRYSRAKTHAKCWILALACWNGRCWKGSV